MTRSVAPIPARAPLIDARTGRITREWMDFFQGLRFTVGGDAARVGGSTADDLAPVSVAVVARDAAPVSFATVSGSAAPVNVSVAVADIAPVSLIPTGADGGAP